MAKYAELIDKAREMLEEDAELFCQMIDELDSWNGYADGFRVFDMYMLNDLYYGQPASKLLEDINGNHFDLSDEYFVDTIYGLRSIEDKYVEYSDNVDVGELLDNIIENYSNLDLDNTEFGELIGEIVNYSD